MGKILAVWFLGFMLLASAAYGAQAPMPGCSCLNEGMCQRRMGMVVRGLGLNEQQKDSIKKIGFGLMKEAVRKRADIAVARIELRELLQKDNVDMGAVGAKLKQIASLQTGLCMSRIKAMEEIKSKLTPEQRLKFRKDMTVWRMRMRRGEYTFARWPFIGETRGMGNSPPPAQ
ncbi:MAG: periplasmic heavy metal sensor [Nitrospiraceae bacterium]|nr:periplasmic heavy metal sensor [Nitrospiraceae bacterium]